MLAVDLTVEIEYAEKVLQLEQNSEVINAHTVQFWQSKINRLNKQLKELTT